MSLYVLDTDTFQLFQDEQEELRLSSAARWGEIGEEFIGR
jgi:hypothetical protein